VDVFLVHSVYIVYQRIAGIQPLAA